MKDMEIYLSCLITLKSDSIGDKVTQCLSGAAGCFPAGSPQHSDSDEQALQGQQDYNYLLILQHLAGHSIQKQPTRGASQRRWCFLLIL